jgi:hypothetical protein
VDSRSRAAVCQIGAGMLYLHPVLRRQRRKNTNEATCHRQNRSGQGSTPRCAGRYKRCCVRAGRLQIQWSHADADPGPVHHRGHPHGCTAHGSATADRRATYGGTADGRAANGRAYDGDNSPTADVSPSHACGATDGRALSSNAHTHGDSGRVSSSIIVEWP